jgi:hypothetical protein
VPVTDEVGCARHPSLIDPKQCVHVVVAKTRAHALAAAQERGIADNDRRFRPLRLVRLTALGDYEHCIATLDVFKRAQDRVAQIGEPVAEHPLDLADPDDDARKLGRVGVRLDSVNGLWPDFGKLHRRS